MKRSQNICSDPRAELENPRPPNSKKQFYFLTLLCPKKVKNIPWMFLRQHLFLPTEILLASPKFRRKNQTISASWEEWLRTLRRNKIGAVRAVSVTWPAATEAPLSHLPELIKPCLQKLAPQPGPGTAMRARGACLSLPALSQEGRALG